MNGRWNEAEQGFCLRSSSSSSSSRSSSIATSSSKQRRRRKRNSSDSDSPGPFAFATAGSPFVRLLLLLLGSTAAGVVSGQYKDGGEVQMTCGDCECTGSSDSGSISVFENPSTGEKVASIEGELSEVVETSCDKLVIASGDTIYELSDVDLGSRELEFVDMSADDCRREGASGDVPDDASCYSGTTFHELGGEVELDLTICFCTWTDGSKKYNVNVYTKVMNANEITIPSDGLIFCMDNGFISQLVTAEVDGSSHFFNFDLALPGESSSADLSVNGGPDSDAQAFICGEDTPTPAPTMKEDPPTPAPVEEEEEDPPTPAPVEEEEEDPPTPSPVKPPTASPTTPAPEPEPVAPETVAPFAVSVVETSEPTPAATPPQQQSEYTTTVGTTSSSGSTVAAPETPAPTDASRGLETPGPSARPLTESPVAVAAATAAPTTAVAVAPTASPVRVDSTVAPAAPAAAGGTLETDAPLTEAELEQVPCTFPRDEPCTTRPTVANLGRGLGAYYDPACSETGCGLFSSECRACYLDSQLYISTADDGSAEASGDIPDYINCPCCVFDTYGESTAADEGGSICDDVESGPDGLETLNFEDKRLSLAGPEGVAIVALGALGLLTFLPSCVK
ncbi:unnamed protein product [Pylaiella littoralis]